MTDNQKRTDRQKVSGQQKRIVITDLDGTLLDHDSYAWQAAAPALQTLRELGIPLIINSSKTRAEISDLRRELENDHPFIIENGAAVVIPANYFAPGPERLVPFSEPREVILDVLATLRDQGFHFHNFDLMSVPELADLAGLSVAAAAMAKRRYATEPLLWEDDPADLARFREALARHQLRLVQGGRFYHVMGFFDKADAMQYLLKHYRAFYQADDPQVQLTAIALGDSPNDLAMLEQADIAVVIQGVNSADLTLSGHPRVIHSDRPGPAGWNQCLLQILAGD